MESLANYFLKVSTQKNKLISSIVIVAGIVFFVWMFFQYLKSGYDDYRLQTHIQSFEERNRNLAQKIEGQKTDYLYYTSDAYLEKYAKSALGLSLPGEKVIVLEEKPTGERERFEDYDPDYEFALMSNTEKWQLYFFGDPILVSKYLSE